MRRTLFKIRKILFLLTLSIVILGGMPALAGPWSGLTPGIWSCEVDRLNVRLEVHSIEGPNLSGEYIHAKRRVAGARVEGTFNNDGVLYFTYQDSWYNKGEGSIRIIDENTLVVSSRETESGRA